MPGEKERNGRFSLLAGNKYFLTLQVGSAVHSHSADNLMGRRTMALDCLNWLQDSAMAHDCGMYLPDVARNARRETSWPGRAGWKGCTLSEKTCCFTTPSQTCSEKRSNHVYCDYVYYIILYRIILLYCVVLYCIVLYCIVLYYFILSYFVLYYLIFYCFILYYLIYYLFLSDLI